MDSTLWQIPLECPLRIRYGLVQEFTVVGRCVGQNRIGIFVEADEEIQTFSDYRAVRQFIPYSSLITVEIKSADEGAQIAARVARGKERRDQVARELEDLLGSEEGDDRPDEPVE